MVLRRGVDTGELPPGLAPQSILNIIQSLGPSFNFGAFQGVNPDDLITLVARNTIAARYMTMHRTLDAAGAGTAGTDYQVEAGKRLIIGGVVYATVAAAYTVVIGYGDDGVAQDNIAAPLNAVAFLPNGVLYGASATTTYTFTMPMIVPATKFPYLHSIGGGSQVFVAGILRPA